MAATDYRFMRLEFGFTSGSGDFGYSRYINEYQVRIYWDETHKPEDTRREEPLEIGRAWVSLFLVGLAMDQEKPIVGIFDHQAEYVNLYEQVYDEQGGYIKPIQRCFESFSFNLLYIRRMALLPNWRSQGLGRKLIKDIVLRFDGCCGVVVMKALPLQFERESLESASLWHQQLLLHSLTQNRQEARLKLAAFGQSTGFKQIADSDLEYLCLGRGNATFDQISLNEYEEL
jgi:GNAT superfamily N-acetyltransferase